MVVVQHALVCCKVELMIVERKLAEADGAILVDDASNLDHAASRELLVIFVADDLDLFAYSADC